MKTLASFSDESMLAELARRKEKRNVKLCRHCGKSIDQGWEDDPGPWRHTVNGSRHCSPLQAEPCP